MKYFLVVLANLYLGILATSAQKKSYDMVSYTPPENWKEETSDSYISYSKTDGGSWAQMAIYKSTASKGSIEEDSQNEWNAVVLALHAIEKEEKGEPASADGWSVVSRSGVWKYKNTNVGTILTTYSNGKICISILCNATAKPYLEDFQKLISSVQLAVPSQTQDTKNASSNNSITGLWSSVVNDTYGYMSVSAQRREYAFNADGTYQFRAKLWFNLVKNIEYIQETGTYLIKGDQITLSPAKGNSEAWSKAANGASAGWGSYQGTLKYPLEKVTYSFERKYFSGMGKTYLVLKSNRPTARDGSRSNNANAIHEFNYGENTPQKSIIDNPPGK